MEDGRKRSGFASLNKDRLREISALGGKTAHQSGHAHQFTSAEAIAANAKRHGKKKKKTA